MALAFADGELLRFDLRKLRLWLRSRLLLAARATTAALGVGGAAGAALLILAHSEFPFLVVKSRNVVAELRTYTPLHEADAKLTHLAHRLHALPELLRSDFPDLLERMK